jgi:hypothetical protein
MSCADCDRLERELANKVRQIGRLERKIEELEGGKPDDPIAPLVRGVFDYWREKCGHPRASIATAEGQRRAKRIRGCLKNVPAGERWQMVKRLQLAIDYVAAFPFVVDAQRVAKGPAAKRYDDIDLIVRKVDTYADRAAAAHDAGAAGLERKLVGA